MNSAVNSLMNPKKSEMGRVLYIDAENHFDPYYVAKYASSLNLPVQQVLNKILVSRAFTWNQVVEIFEERLPELENSNIQAIIVANITKMFDKNLQKSSKVKGSYHNLNYDSENLSMFHDLKRIFTGIKSVTRENDPLVLLSGPFYRMHSSQVIGGHLLSHFCGIILKISESEHYHEYLIHQHPFLPPILHKFSKIHLSHTTHPLGSQKGRFQHSLEDFASMKKEGI